MESSGRNGDDAKRSGRNAPAESLERIERSPDGQLVVRASSYPPASYPEGSSSFPPGSFPPGSHATPLDASGVRARPRDQTASTGGAAPSVNAPVGRSGRSTPAERPRKRKALQDNGGANLRARCDTPRALPGARGSWPKREPLANAVIAASEKASPRATSATDLADADLVAINSGGTMDEVTRRVRRPSSLEPAAAAMPWRGFAIAIAMMALLGLAIWLAL